MSAQQASRRASGDSRYIVILLSITVLVAGFVVMRYRGLWGEGDTSTFAIYIRAMLVEAQLVPHEAVYPNGYGFPVLAAFLVRITGLSVAQLQLFGGALLAVWILIPAWLAYRELTGSVRGAALATVFILIQPELLFSILRGSHEKFSRGLMFLCLYLLLRSILARQDWRRFGAFLAAFYLAVYALVTFNNLLSISFITALALSLVLSLFVRYLSRSRSDANVAARRRLLYASLTSLVLAFFFTFYAYSPARHGIFVAETVYDRLILLFLDVEAEVGNPYQTISIGWINLQAYLLVSIANWLLLISSFALWSIQTLSWLRKRSWPDEPRQILLWALYGAFGFLGATSIFVDISGAIAGNLQHRTFPSFAMIAAAVVADWITHRQVKRQAFRGLVYGALAVSIAFLSVMAIAKATNEPLISNKWLYYTPSEFAALEWTRTVNPNELTWTPFDNRLKSALEICCAWESEKSLLDGWLPDPGTNIDLISDVVRAQRERLNQPYLTEGGSLRVYDNGAAEIYRLRPRTPFQK